MSKLRQASFWMVMVLLTGQCGLPLPTLEGIDLVQWKNDKNGCLGKRSEMLEALKNQKKKLEGLTEEQITGLLGRPDRNELYRRNQKFYHYFLQPGPGCPQSSGKPLELSVRFNATERAKEIAIE